MIIVHTDGSSRGNPGPGGWGTVIEQDDKVIELGGSEPHTTNNRMELTAAIKSLKFASDEKILIYTDSEYVMKGITEWIHNWQKKGWKTAGRKPVLNQDLWQELLKLTAGKEVEWKYVAGHAGVHLNERADVIATTFADLPAGRQVGKPVLYHGPRDKYK